MKQLLDLGLNEREAQVYLALQELGEAKTGVICKKLNIPNSHIYSILAKLQDLGLVSFKYANKVKVFKATDPQALQLLFERKQEDLKKQENDLLGLIKDLKKLPKNKETDSDYQYFEGLKGVKGMILEAYTTTPKNSEMKLISAVSESWALLNAFFLDMHKIRVERNIALKMILQKNTKDLRERIQERNNIGLVDIRINNFTNHAELFLTKDYVMILDTSLETKTPCGFMIKNKIFLALFNQLFDYVWESSKKTI